MAAASRVPWTLVERMVPIALAAVRELIDDGELDRTGLESDPLTELENWDEVIVRRLPPALIVPPPETLGGECSVSGTYYDWTPTSRPAIAVAESSSRRRDAFTALHELGHHLQRTNLSLADELGELERDMSFRVEDAVCERFAAAVLIPSAAATRFLGTGTPTAGDIVTFVDNISASRAAACIRASENLAVPGMVVLLNEEDIVQIAPPRGLPPLRRGSSQAQAEVVRRARALEAGGSYRFRVADDDTHFQYRDGIEGDSLFAQAADIGNGYLVIVAVTEAPPWKDTFTLPKFSTGPRAKERVCPHPECGEPFSTWAETHDVCGEPRCTNCYRCACSLTHVRERPCEGCHLMQPNHLFENDTAKVCVDCA